MDKNNMSKKQFKNRILKDFPKLSMPYYKANLLDFNIKNSSYTAVRLKFVIPWNTLQNLTKYCQDCGLCMDIEEGYLQIYLFDTSYIKQVKI